MEPLWLTSLLRHANQWPDVYTAFNMGTVSWDRSVALRKSSGAFRMSEKTVWYLRKTHEKRSGTHIFLDVVFHFGLLQKGQKAAVSLVKMIKKRPGTQNPRKTAWYAKCLDVVFHFGLVQKGHKVL